MLLSVQRIVRNFIVVGPDQIGIKSEIRECKNSAREDACTVRNFSCKPFRSCSLQQASLDLQWLLTNNLTASAGYLHNFGSRILLGRDLGAVFNPLAGGLDRVVNLESSGKTKYDALNLSVEKRLGGRWHLLANYTLSKSFNYATSDQLPFFAGMADPNNPGLEYGPSSFDRRHRFSMSGQYKFPFEIRAAAVWTVATGTPMDILLPDASARLPFMQRNAGGRLFRAADELNRFIYIRQRILHP